MEWLLQVEQLTVGRDGAPLLAELSFSLRAGEALILQGPNGAGKTTLLRSLAGFLPPISGQIIADEPAFAGHLDGVKAQLSVAENLRFWAAVHGGGAIDAALDRFDLHALRNRPARALSAGQKRRLGLARLVLTGRRLWLLDEPTVSLDKASVARFAGVVQQHLEAGGAALIATHTDLGLEAPILDLGPYRLLNARAGAGAAMPSAAPKDQGSAGFAVKRAENAVPRAETAPGPVDAAAAPPVTKEQSGSEQRPSHPALTAPKHDPFGAGW